MFVSSRARRFRPSIDVLPSRLAPSGGLEPCPMDPSFDPWTPPEAPCDSCPMDPSFDPWLPPNADWYIEEEGALDELATSIIRHEPDPTADTLVAS